MYIVGFAPLIILEIVLLPRCIVIYVHLGLVYVCCWFCPCTLSSVTIWDSSMYFVGFGPLIILEIVFFPLCIVKCVHLGLMYVRCWF
jgi:hypothetical protein